VRRGEVLTVDDEDIDVIPDAPTLEVVKVSDATEARGVLCHVMRGERVQALPVSELVPLDAHNRRIWGDYITWFDGVMADGRVTPDEEELDEDETLELDEDEE
jgi:hypothetical protein